MVAEPGSGRMDGGARFWEDGWRRSQVQRMAAEPGSGRMDGGAPLPVAEVHLGGWMAAEPGSVRMDGGARLREE